MVKKLLFFTGVSRYQSGFQTYLPEVIVAIHQLDQISDRQTAHLR